MGGFLSVPLSRRRRTSGSVRWRSWYSCGNTASVGTKRRSGRRKSSSLIAARTLERFAMDGEGARYPRLPSLCAGVRATSEVAAIALVREQQREADEQRSRRTHQRVEHG